MSLGLGLGVGLNSSHQGDQALETLDETLAYINRVENDTVSGNDYNAQVYDPGFVNRFYHLLIDNNMMSTFNTNGIALFPSAGIKASPITGAGTGWIVKCLWDLSTKGYDFKIMHPDFPTLMEQDRNGKNAFYFDANNYFLQTYHQDPTIGFLRNVGYGEITTITQAAQRGDGLAQMHVSIRKNAHSRESRLTVESIQDEDRVEWRRLDADTLQSLPSTPMDEDYKILNGVAKFSLGEAHLYKNNVLVNSDTTSMVAGNTSDTDSDGITIGGRNQAGTQLDGKLLGVIMWNTEITDQFRSNLNNFLIEEFAIPV